MPEEAKVKSSRPGFDDEGYRLCQYCGELDFAHYEKDEITHKCPTEPHHHPESDNPYKWVAGPSESGVLCKLTSQVLYRAKVDEWGSFFRKPCQQQVDHRVQRYYSSKLRACSIPAPEKSPLTDLIKFEPPKVNLSSAVIFATPGLFQSHMKTYLQFLLADYPKLKFTYVDGLTVTRIRNIRFDKDGEFKTFEELNEHPLLIFDMDVSPYVARKGAGMEDADLLELLSMRGRRATWFVLSGRKNLGNIPHGVRENIKLLVANPVDLMGGQGEVVAEKAAAASSLKQQDAVSVFSQDKPRVKVRVEPVPVDDTPEVEKVISRVIYLVCTNEACSNKDEQKFDAVKHVRSLKDYIKSHRPKIDSEDDAIVTIQDDYIRDNPCECGETLSKVEGK